MTEKDPRSSGALLTMLDALPEQIARYRLSDLVVLYCNAAKAAVYDTTPEEMTGRSLHEILTAQELTELREHLEQLGPERRVLREVKPWIRPQDGQQRWLEWVDQWYPGSDGAELLTVGRDVTERHLAEQRLRESQERFRLAMADAPIGMALVGLDARFLDVNAALCELLGRSREELLTLTTIDITHPDDVDADLAYGRASQQGQDQPGLVKRYVRPDGTVVSGLLKVSTVRADDGHPAYIIGQVIDITAQLAHEDQLRRAAEAEHAAAEQLRQLDEVKNAFLTAVSHELRTPLTVVRGMATTLQRLGDRADEALRGQMTSALEHHADRLSALLDDLLDLDRLVRGTLTVQADDLDLSELVRDQVAATSAADRILLQAPPSLRVAGDRVQLERIVANLLENAEKYAPHGDVEVVLRHTDAGLARLEVRDEGPGIPARDREVVFEPFHRGGGDHPQPGTGIGLSLVREFVRLHGGQIWVEPSDTGAHVIAELPVQPPARTASNR